MIKIPETPINLTEARAIISEYNQWKTKEIDPFTAYSLQNRASGEMIYLDGWIADHKALASQFKHDIETTLSELSIKLTDGGKAKSVTDAERRAKVDPQYQKVIQNMIQAQKIVDHLQSYKDYMSRIYFDCKNYYFTAEQNLRKGH